jgi:hypothetical protein
MTDSDRLAGHRLLETGTLVEFSIVKQSIEEGPDDAEFAVRVDLVFSSEDDAGIEAEDIAEWTPQQPRSPRNVIAAQVAGDP